MDIRDILSADMVVVDVEADNKRQLLSKLSTYVADKCGLDKNSVFEAIWERENLGSTGYGKGIAFPHARINGLNKIITLFARIKSAVDFESLDAKPVDILAYMISPEKSGEDHLQALALFSRVLKNDDVCKQIREAKNTHEIYLALNK